MKPTLAEVQSIVRRVSGSRRILPTSRLFHDLGLAGDDAAEVLEEIAAKYEVDFSGFAFSRYFPEEGEAIAANLARVLHMRLRREPLTVEHLAAVAQHRAWFAPPSVSD